LTNKLIGSELLLKVLDVMLLLVLILLPLHQTFYDFSHKTIASINNTANVGGFFGTRIVVTNNSSGIATAFAADYAELRRSMKVSVISNAGSGKAFIQQVQNA
jgi:uncharacterized membrane protein YbhN (UPF0104 family)